MFGTPYLEISVRYFNLHFFIINFNFQYFTFMLNLKGDSSPLRPQIQPVVDVDGPICGVQYNHKFLLNTTYTYIEDLTNLQNFLL